MMLKSTFIQLFCWVFMINALSAETYTLYLRDNLRRAQPGDFIVVAQGKNYNLLQIYARTDSLVTVQEISVPIGKFPKYLSWRDWVKDGAPQSTSRVVYTIDLNNAQMQNYYTYGRGGWYEMLPQNSFLSTLLSLRFHFVQPSERKKIGIGFSSERPLWQPKMVMNGKTIEGVYFDLWKTVWPKDNSELSGKTIEVYLPEEGHGYPAYFPYWLQISGIVGSNKVRIIDSGTGLFSNLTLPKAS